MRFAPLKQEIKRPSHGDHLKKVQGKLARWGLLLGVYLFVVLLTSPFLLYKPPAPQAGELLDQSSLKAWTDFQHTTEKARQDYMAEREQKHQRIFKYNNTAREDALRTLETVFRSTDGLDPARDSNEQMSAVLKRAYAKLSLTLEETPEFVNTLKDPRFREGIRSVVKEAYDNHVIIPKDQLLKFQGLYKDRLVEVPNADGALTNRRFILEDPLPFPDWYEWSGLLNNLNEAYGPDSSARKARTQAEKLLSAVVRPNLTFDPERTRISYEDYPQRDLATTYTKDQPLITGTMASNPLSEDQATLLAAHRDAVIHENQLRLIGHALFVLIVFLLISVYMMRLSREYYFSTDTIYLVSLPILIALALQAAMILLADGKSTDVGYLFPAGMIGVLCVLLLEIRLALLLVTSGCLLVGLQTDLNYQFVIVGLVGGYTAVAALATIRKRWELFLASILIGLANSAIILITGFIQNPGNVPLGSAILGFFGGVSSFLVLAILPLFERFGIITDIQLLEMTGLQHPLLRILEEQAPGTWQHTLNVTKLAEAAATKIGVNYLLVRAGCYYHDVGKVKKPEYFTENQNTAEDKARHDALKPIMSVRVIMNHVKEGVEMARQHGIPERIIDFIVQHHGSSVIRYFYNKALEAQERGEIKEEVRIEDYRYPGKKPQTIEAAIVMLADAVEATATAKLSARTVREEDIKQVVRVTVLDKFNDGQFDECNLTLRDLNQIRQTFVEVLKSRFHTRIDYPKRPAMANAPKVKKPEKTIEPTTGSRSTTEAKTTEV